MAVDTEVRRKAYDSYIKTLHKYKNTYAATYATEITKQVTMAKLRGYDSVTDMLLHPHQVTKEMYNNQLDIIQKELAPHMRRFAKLKQKDYGLDEMRFCDLKISLDPSYSPETSFDEAKTMILAALQKLGPEYNAIMEEAFKNSRGDNTENIEKQYTDCCASPTGAH